MEKLTKAFFLWKQIWLVILSMCHCLVTNMVQLYYKCLGSWSPMINTFCDGYGWTTELWHVLHPVLPKRASLSLNVRLYTVNETTWWKPKSMVDAYLLDHIGSYQLFLMSQSNVGPAHGRWCRFWLGTRILKRWASATTQEDRFRHIGGWSSIRKLAWFIIHYTPIIIMDVTLDMLIINDHCYVHYTSI